MRNCLRQLFGFLLAIMLLPLLVSISLVMQPTYVTTTTSTATTTTTTTTVTVNATHSNMRHTSTWLACQITPEIVNWCLSLHLTDVVLRAWSREQDYPAAYALFKAANITMWGVWGFYQDFQCPTDKPGLEVVLRDWVNRTPGGRVFLDDCHELRHWHGDQALVNLLNAIRAVQTITANESNLIACFYWGGKVPDFAWSQFNLTGIDCDFYTETTFADYAVMPVTNASSTGGCIWAWRQGGWNGLSTNWIAQQYNTAKGLGFSRMIDWSGYEPDYYPNAQMRNADLYWYPSWCALIASLNEQFLTEISN
jgi:hypothetical protein